MSILPTSGWAAWLCSCVLFAYFCSMPAPAFAEEYVSPDHEIAFEKPKDASVECVNQSDGTVKLTISSGSPLLKHIFLIVRKPNFENEPADLRQQLLIESSKPYFQGWVGAMKESNQMTGLGQVQKSTLAGRDALKLEFRFRHSGQLTEKIARGYYVFGAHHAFFLAFSAAVGDEAELDAMIASMHLEP